MVTYHLRTAAEGKYREYHVPKTKRLLSGLRSFEVTAAVAAGGIVMWRIVPGPWNGEEAAAMYSDLGACLEKANGRKSSYRVVEDGDRKGYHSTKGKVAKQAASIISWKLPPRTPQWMPLDFCIWHEIEKRVLVKNVRGHESFEAYVRRVRSVAMKLPASLVDKCLASMKSRIQAVIDTKGKATVCE